MTDINAPKSSKKKRNTLLTLFLLIIAAGVGAWFFLIPRGVQTTDDAYVAGQQVMVTSQEPGTVDAIYVDNTQKVTKDQPLLMLNGNKLALQQQSAEAKLATTLREVKSRYVSIEQIQAQINAEKIVLLQAKQDYKRRLDGNKGGQVYISPEVLAHAKNSVTISQQKLVALHKQLQATQLQLPTENVLQNPQVQAAISTLRQVYLAQLNSTIYAPKDGMIANRIIQVGQQIQAGQHLMTIVPLNKLWVDANFKEIQLANMKPGQPVTLESDLYGEKHEYQGVVAGIGAGTGSAFSAIPAQNATGNWIKIIQRVPVRIYLDPSQLASHPLRIGMSMKVTVKTSEMNDKPFDHTLFTADETLTQQSKQRLEQVDLKITHYLSQLGQ